MESIAHQVKINPIDSSTLKYVTITIRDENHFKAQMNPTALETNYSRSQVLVWVMLLGLLCWYVQKHFPDGH